MSETIIRVNDTVRVKGGGALWRVVGFTDMGALLVLENVLGLLRPTGGLPYVRFCLLDKLEKIVPKAKAGMRYWDKLLCQYSVGLENGRVTSLHDDIDSDFDPCRFKEAPRDPR